MPFNLIDPFVMNSTSADQVGQSTDFCPFPISLFLSQAIAALGYESPTPVQSAVWDLWSSTPDAHPNLMVSSQTGSGKTLAFLMPVLESIEVLRRSASKPRKAADAHSEPATKRASGKRRNPFNPRHFVTPQPSALVLCPTRELAQQVANDAINLVKAGKGPRVACLVGGMPYAVQMSRLQNVDLVIATPGRLLDLADSGSLDLSQVKWLVLDEADRMLDLGFAPDLARVDEMTSQRSCTMMFSATFDPPIELLAKKLAPNAQRLQLNDNRKAHEGIEQRLYWADDESHRTALLQHWLRDTSIEQAIIFTSTQVGCESLAQYLHDEGFSATSLHGALSQAVRNRRLSQLRTGRIQFLVATDVAARGIDVPGISHVFNHGLPMKDEDHVHRIGRTGRAGRKGMAITLALFRETRKIRSIEHYLGRSMEVHVVEGLEPKARTAKPKPAFRNKPGSGRNPHHGRASNGSRSNRSGVSEGSYAKSPHQAATHGGGKAKPESVERHRGHSVAPKGHAPSKRRSAKTIR